MLASVLIVVLAQSDIEGRMGLSDRQIMNLGSVEFVNRYSEKFGSSTAAMTGAFETYGLAVKRLNEAAFTKKPSATRAAVKSLRTRMADFRNEMCTIGSAFSGGGTMWNITYSETLGDVEDALTYLSGVRTTKPKSFVVSDVTKVISQVEKQIKTHAEDLEIVKESGGGTKQANASLKLARTAFSEIVKIAAKRPRRESDAILDFCVNAARIPLNTIE